jgi:hypothetical protein
MIIFLGDDESTLRRIEKLLARVLSKFLTVVITIGGKSMGKSLAVKLGDAPGVASATGIVGIASFSSDNPAVATVDPVSGQLAYVSVGLADIIVTDSADGATDSCALGVFPTASQVVETLTPGAAPAPTPAPTPAVRASIFVPKR